MNKKGNFTIILAVICLLAAGQANKPEAGDFGIRYGVSFNGTPTQTLTFSGMVKNNWEIGSSINVQYSQTNGGGSYNTTVYSYAQGTYIPVTETSKSVSKTIGVNISPFFVYHFSNKSNLDLYAGANVIIGTSAIRLSSGFSDVMQGAGFYREETSSSTYPPGYQIGGGVILGGQYFFFKRLALGINANLGCLYSGTKGTYSSVTTTINSGGNNGGVPFENDASYNEINSHAFSLKTGSSISLTLAFYMGTKRKAKKQTEGLQLN